MALLSSTRTVQSRLVAEFSFGRDDTIVNTAGATVDFGLTNTAATTAVIIPLPPGAVVLSGYLNVTEAFDAATYAVTIGDTTDPDRYLTTADRKGVAKTPLVPTGYVGVGENIVIVFTAADACVATGLATVVVEYIVRGRACEVQVA